MSLSHIVYAIGTICVVLTMILRRNVLVPCIVSTFLIGLLYKKSIVQAVMVIFNANIVALIELGSIFIIIALMVAMLESVNATGADKLLVTPLRKLMISPSISYIVIAASTFIISLFFWPTPAVPLIGTLLIPAAIKAGLPPLSAAVALALAGQGMALSSDIIIQGAPNLSAKAAGIPVAVFNKYNTILSVIAGLVALTIAYFMMRKDIKQFEAKNIIKDNVAFNKSDIAGKNKYAPVLATLMVIAFIGVIIAMFAFDIKGGDASSLLGGTAVLIMTISTLLIDGIEGFDKIADYLTSGLIFSFKVMGQILPIAGFFFLGNPETVVNILGEGAPGFLFDIGQMLANLIPAKGFSSAFGMLILGVLTGLDGSGFSGLPMTGTLAGAIAGGDTITCATLAAIGQMGAIWSGGGTLVAWSSLVAVSGIAGVSVLDLVRKNFIPVIIGMIVSTVFAVIFFM